MQPEPLLLGFDVGTTTAKGGAFDLSGELLALGEEGYEIDRPAPGLAEQDPLDWWAALLAVLRSLGETVELARVAAVGVCSQVNTHVFLDAAGEPIGPAMLWQDQRCAEVAAGLESSLTDADRDRLWGGPFPVDASFLMSRTAWLKLHRPADWERVRYVLSPKDYVNLRLCGEVATDPISPIGLVGPGGAYLEGVLALVPGTAERMPPIRAFTHPLGAVRDRQTGLGVGTTVVVATMDAWGNLFGSGVVEAGQAMEVAGTSEIIGALSTTGCPTRGVVSFLPVDGLVFHAGPTQAGGEALRWFSSVHGVTLEQALAEAAASAPGSLGLVFLPYLQGERAPIWDATARGVFFGLRAEHRREHLARAVLEGVAYSARHVLEAVEAAASLSVSALQSSGGGARSDLWCQIKADVLGREIHRLRVSQSGVLGAALMAGVGAGLLPCVRQAAAKLVHLDRTFTPRPENHGPLSELYGIYRDLYPALGPAYARLGNFTSRDIAH